MSGLDDDSDSSADSEIVRLKSLGLLKWTVDSKNMTIHINPLFAIYNANEFPAVVVKLKQNLVERCTKYLETYDRLMSFKTKYDTEIASLDLSMMEAKVLYMKFRLCEEKKVPYSVGGNVLSGPEWIKTINKLRSRHDRIRYILVDERNGVSSLIHEFNQFLLKKIAFQDKAPVKPELSPDFETLYSQLEIAYKKVTAFVAKCHSLRDVKDDEVNPKYTDMDNISFVFNLNELLPFPHCEEGLVRLNVERIFLTLLNSFGLLAYYRRQYRIYKYRLHKTLVVAKIFILKAYYYNLHKIPFPRETIYSDPSETLNVFHFLRTIHLDIQMTEVSRMKAAILQEDYYFRKFVRENLKSFKVTEQQLFMNKANLEEKCVDLSRKVRDYIELYADTCSNKILRDNVNTE